jgi:hypothetical protein
MNWESADSGNWNRIRLSEKSDTELTIKRAGMSHPPIFEVRLCGRVIGTTRDRDEHKRRDKAMKMLRDWVSGVHVILVHQAAAKIAGGAK